MYQRTLQLPMQQSCFLFGARGVGKSTLLRQLFDENNSYWFNLLDPVLEAKLLHDPNEFAAIVRGLPEHQKTVVIDEVQKVPKLLDLVHMLIEEKQHYFVMTGSSARKLQQEGVNLLAGRAFVYHLYPLTSIELAENFDLEMVLNWGLLPQIYHYATPNERKNYLYAYALTFLKEEIWAEQFIRKLEPFRRFLEVSAQQNGKIINLSKIAREVGVSDKTVKEYYAILEDTLVGFVLEPFHNSYRKRLLQKPKFYYFDPGVARALTHHLSVPITTGTSYYGEIFEHFIILECVKLAAYHQLDYRFSYMMTQDGEEVDLIVERPNLSLLLIEIKSNSDVREANLKTLHKISAEIPGCEAICISNNPQRKKYGDITVLPWQLALQEYFN